MPPKRIKGSRLCRTVRLSESKEKQVHFAIIVRYADISRIKKIDFMIWAMRKE